MQDNGPYNAGQDYSQERETNRRSNFGQLTDMNSQEGESKPQQNKHRDG